MPGDSEQKRKPARVVGVPTDKGRFVNDERKILATANPIKRPTEEQSQSIKLFDKVGLKGTIAHTKALAIIRSPRQIAEVRNFVPVIFTPPIPNNDPVPSVLL